MTTKEINDGNRIIAEFIGYEYIPFGNETGIKPGWWNLKTSQFIRKQVERPDKLVGNLYLGRTVRDLPYNKDWNFLMGACKKWDCLNESPIPIAVNKSLKQVEKEYVELCDDSTI